MNETAGPPALVTVLGTNPRLLHYRLGSATVYASHAGLALARLLPESPRTIIAVCTPEAKREQLPSFRSDAAGIPVELLSVELSGEPSAVPRLVESLGEAIQSSGPVIVDLTNGPRHVAVLAFAAAALVSALGESNIQGVYYAWVADSTADFLDLQGLVTVLNLTHAARSFGETGSPGAVAGFLEATTSDAAQAAQAAGESLKRFAWSRMAGLPLEQGRAAADVWQRRESLRRLFKKAGLPMAARITERLVETVEPIRLEVGGHGWKRRVALDEAELNRERKIIDERIGSGAWSTALLLMEEWLVSWTIRRDGKAQDWLDKKVRRGASYRLHSLREIEKLDPARLTDEQKRLARLWSCLSEARNSLAHAGMDGEPVDLTQGKLGKNLAEVKQGWSWLANDPAVPLSSAGPDHVMVSPLGRMPGALYTALRKYPQVERCLVITSAEAEGNLTNLGVRLGRPVVFETIRLADPLAGVSELKKVISQARPHLLDAARVYVHLTGGSTLMGYICERLGEAACRLGRPVQRFLTLDRRSTAKQAAQPFVEGEVIELPTGASEEAWW